MGKKYTAAEVLDIERRAYNNGHSDAQADYDDKVEALDDMIEEYGRVISEVTNSAEPIDPEHGSYTLTVRYKHTKYAGDDTDFTTALVKELAEDEFRFVTDHFDVLSVEVNADTLWQA